MPKGWAWIRQKNLGIALNGKAFKPSDWTKKGLPIVRIQNLNDKNAPYNYYDKDVDETFLLHGGELLFAWSGTPGTSFGAHIWDKGEAVLNQHIFKILFDETIINKIFYKYCLNNQVEKLIEVAHGSAGLAHITKNMFDEVLIPLPPYNEQLRIVTEFEKIISLINYINDNKTELNDTIKQTKSKILDLAIHGKLVPQDPNDEPAEELLKRISTSDNRPYKKFEEEEPFEIPSNWSWCFLGDICSKIKRGKSPKYVDKSTIMAFAQKCNQKDGPTSLDKALYIDETTLKKYPEEEKMQFNDIVINSTGTGTLGRVGIFNCSIPNDVNAVYPDSHVTTVRILPEIDKLYCYYFIKNKQSYLETIGEGSTNQKELKPDTISSLCFPLPPYPEQKRIVFKIEELFSSLETIVSNLD